MFVQYLIQLKLTSKKRVRRLLSSFPEGVRPRVEIILHEITRSFPGRTYIVNGLKRLLFLLIALSIVTFLYERYVTSIEKRFYYKYMTGIRYLESKECIIPHIDPHDARWRKYFFKVPPIICGHVQPFLTYVDDEGVLRINESGVQEYGFDGEEISCAYSYIRRVAHDDFNVTFTHPIAFKTSVKLNEPFVRVQCFKGLTQETIYETAHAFIPPLSRELSARVQPGSPERPSVLLLGLDSVSRLNFIRQLPKTHALLRDEIKAVEFQGAIKVGENTYPNMLAMMAAYDAFGDHWKVTAPVWGEQFNRTTEFYDRLPALWYNFSSNGYVTMYAEDMPEFNMFDFMAKGFDHPPTDYYMRPFWLAMESFKLFRSRSEQCYQNIPNYEYLFNQTRQFVRKMSDKRFFSFNFLTGFSHSKVNLVQVLDDALYELLTDLYRSGTLRNVMLMVFGDHGQRFDTLRTTLLGRVEEQMPFLAVALPPYLRVARPYLQKALEMNRETLISWYDVYEMLADIAFDNMGPTSLVERYGSIGYSLFRPVPKTRTCPEVGAQTWQCICEKEVEVSPDSAEVRSAGHVLVSHVNLLLAESEWMTVCVYLSLDSVHSAQKIIPSEYAATTEGFSVTVRVQVSVFPSGALLEGVVERSAWSPQGHVVGTVQRINAYGNQSHCVRDPQLRLYCFCRDLLPTAGENLTTT